MFYGILIVLAYLVFLVFQPFLASLAWAVVLVVVAYPVYARLARRWGRTLAATASTLGVTLIIIVPTLLVTGAFIRQGVEAVQLVQQQIQSGHFSWVNDLWLRIQERFPDANPGDLTTVVHRYARRRRRLPCARLGAVLRNTAVFLFHLTVMILAMFYLFRDGDAIVARLREVLPFEKSHRERMIDETRELIFASVTSSIVAAVAHGVLGGLAFGLTGIHAPIFWGVMMGFFSLVPVVGSALIWVPAATSLMVNGHIGLGIVLIDLLQRDRGTGGQYYSPLDDQRPRPDGRIGGVYQRFGWDQRFRNAGRWCWDRLWSLPERACWTCTRLVLSARNTKSKAGGNKLDGVLE